MKSLSPKLLIWWMAATMAHLPFPVCDGNDFATCLDGCAAAEQCGARRVFDIDFILLGCFPPVDVDEGPFNRDPQDIQLGDGLFPVCLSSRTAHDAWDQSLLPLIEPFAPCAERRLENVATRLTRARRLVLDRACPRENPVETAILRC